MRPGQTGFADFFLHIFLTPAVPVAAKHAPEAAMPPAHGRGNADIFRPACDGQASEQAADGGLFSIAKQQNNNASQQRLTEKSIFTAGSLPAQKRPFDKLGKMVTPETAEKCQT